MKVTIKEARKLAKDLRKKYNCYCNVAINFKEHAEPIENIYVYVESNNGSKNYQSVKEARDELL